MEIRKKMVLLFLLMAVGLPCMASEDPSFLFEGIPSGGGCFGADYVPLKERAVSKKRALSEEPPTHASPSGSVTTPAAMFGAADFWPLHSPEYNLACSECGFVADSSPKLASHVRVHEGVCPFVCGECMARFKTSVMVSRHLVKMHPGARKRQLTCSDCDFEAMQLCDLKNHRENIHTNEYAYKCPACDSSWFQSKKELFIHQRDRCKAR